MNSQYKIRFAEPKDISQIITLCEAHATYEQCEYSRENKVNFLNRDLFSIPVKLYCLVVAKEENLIGYATYTKQYSTWDAYEYIYLDCLFLKEEARGENIGEQIIERIKIEGKKLDCNNMQWQTPSFNTGAIKFYKRIGATLKNKERFFLEIT